MKMKEITEHQAIHYSADVDVYIMIRMTDDTPVEVLRLAEGYLLSEPDTEPAPVPAPAKVEEIKPAGEFTHEDQWAETDKPAQKKGKYDVGKICALRRASWSVAKIADEIGCSEQTVRNILKREGMV